METFSIKEQNQAIEDEKKNLNILAFSHGTIEPPTIQKHPSSILDASSRMMPPPPGFDGPLCPVVQAKTESEQVKPEAGNNDKSAVSEDLSPECRTSPNFFDDRPHSAPHSVPKDLLSLKQGMGHEPLPQSSKLWESYTKQPVDNRAPKEPCSKEEQLLYESLDRLFLDDTPAMEENRGSAQTSPFTAKEPKPERLQSIWSFDNQFQSAWNQPKQQIGRPLKSAEMPIRLHPAPKEKSATASSRYLSVVGKSVDALDRDFAHTMDSLRNLEGLREIRGGHASMGSILVLSFFDIRHAQTALHLLQTSLEFSSALDAYFCSPEELDVTDVNQGFLVVKGLPPFLNSTQIKTIFQRFGDVRRLEPRWLVEFYDIRDAAFAQQNLNGLALYNHSIKAHFADAHVFEQSTQEILRRELEEAASSRRKTALASPMTPAISRPASSFALGEQRSFSNQDMPTSLPHDNRAAMRSATHGTSHMRAQKSMDVPASNRIDLLKILRGEETRTTVMFKHLPNKLSQDQLLSLLTEICPSEFDCVYLRVDFRNKCNCGYCFINFIDPRSVAEFTLRVSGKRWKQFNSEKVCEVTFANIQGKQAFIEKFRNSQVMLEDVAYRPKIFFSGGPMKGKEARQSGMIKLSDTAHYRVKLLWVKKRVAISTSSNIRLQ